MLFKSVARSASAAKTLWVPAGSNQQVPSFFVSTPQFKRQQHQVSVYREDNRGANSSNNHIGQSHGALSISGASNYSTVASSSLDEDHRDDPAGTQVGNITTGVLRSKIKPTNLKSSLPTSDAEPLLVGISGTAGSEVATDPEQVPIVQPVTTDELLGDLIIAHNAGEHSKVVEVFSFLDQDQSSNVLTVETYNLLLESLAQLALEAEDMSLLLQPYQRLLSRNVVPSRRTYGIVIAALTQMAQRLESRRKSLMPLVGPADGRLEASSEVIESLAAEDHLRLALEIFRASTVVDASNYDQEAVDTLVSTCCRCGVDCPDVVPFATPSPCQLNHAKSVSDAKKLWKALTKSNDADIILIKRLMTLGNKEVALKFFQDEGEPEHLIQPLIECLAQQGYVATASQWTREYQNVDAGKVLQVITCSQEASDVLASVMRLFQLAAAQNQLDSLSRRAVISLCLQARDFDSLKLVIQESKLRHALWDPSTVVDVVEYLVSVAKEPLLASDVFVWQAKMLETEWRQADLATFIGQEMIQMVVSTFQKHDTLSLEVALALAPFTVASQTSRDAVFNLIWAARIGASAEYRAALLASSSSSLDILEAHVAWILSCDRDGHLAMPEETRESFKKVLSRLVEDVLIGTTPITEACAARVSEMLRLVENNEFDGIWPPKRSGIRSDEGVKTTPVSGGDDSTPNFSEDILRYSNTPHGLDTALDLVERSKLCKVTISGPALVACVQAVATAKESLSKLDKLIMSVPFDNNSDRSSYLNAVVEKASLVDWSLAMSAYQRLLTSDSVIVPKSYVALVSRAPTPSQVVILINDARSRGLMTSADLYNSAILRLSQAKRLPEVELLLDEALEANLVISSEAETAVIKLQCQNDNIEGALKGLDYLEANKLSSRAVGAYNAVISFFVNEQDRDSALDTFTRLRKAGVIPTPHSYKLLMEGYLLPTPAPELENADRVLALMHHDGAPISTQCLATLLRARGVLLRDFESARDFYRGLVKKSRVLPDKRIFKALLESYHANGKQSEMPLVLREMAKYHVPLDNEMTNILECS